MKTPLKFVMHTLVLLLIFATTACNSNEPMQQDNVRKVPRSALYPAMRPTSVQELEDLYHYDTSNVIHYREARCLAELEILAGAYTLIGRSDGETWYLTQYPRVIYNYDNTPKYYEFGYVVNGVIEATITTYAQKEADGVIAYAITPALTYNDDDLLNYYIGEYPKRYYGHYRCESSAMDGTGDIPLYLSSGTDEEMLTAYIDSLPTNSKDSFLLEYDSEATLQYKAKCQAYWDTIRMVDSTFTNDFYEEIAWHVGDEASFITKDWIDGNVTPTMYSDAYYVARFNEVIGYDYDSDIETIPSYSDRDLQMTHWDGWCGPAALAWIYRGKYNRYPIGDPNGYLKIHGDGDEIVILAGGRGSTIIFADSTTYAFYCMDFYYGNDYGLYEARTRYCNWSDTVDHGLSRKFYEVIAPVWELSSGHGWHVAFPLMPDKIDNCLETVTNGNWTSQFTTHPYEWIINTGEPVMINVYEHFIVAFEACATYKKNGNIKDKYLKVTDNGHYTGCDKKRLNNYSGINTEEEAAKYAPYWRRVNLWNAHYGVKINN